MDRRWTKIFGALLICGLLALSADSRSERSAGAGEEPAVDRNTLLLRRAVFLGDAPEVERLLAAGADATVTDDYQVSLLHLAAGLGYEDVAGLLIDHGADLNAVDWWRNTPLIEAIDEGHPEVARILIEAGAEVNPSEKYALFTPLSRAARIGDYESCRLLLDRGADVNFWSFSDGTALQAAVEENRAEVVGLLMKNGAVLQMDGRLYYDILTGQSELAKVLIREGAIIDEEKFDPPLILAAYLHDPDLVSDLLSKGADPNVRTGSSGHPPGATPIYISSQSLDYQTAKVLLEHGADPNILTCTDWSPLLAALGKKGDVRRTKDDQEINISEEEVLNFVDLLLAHGVKPDLIAASALGWKKEVKEMLRQDPALGRSETAREALRYAAMYGQTGVIRILLKAGADIRLDESEALEAATENGEVGTVRLLLAKGADPNRDDDSCRISALHLAASNPEPTATRLGIMLIAAGADLEAKDHGRDTALFEAIDSGATGLVRLLILAGADVNAKGGSEETPLFKSSRTYRCSWDKGMDKNKCIKSRITSTRLLISHGADVNARNWRRETPLHHASNAEIVRMFIKAGADPNARNEWGYTPLYNIVNNDELEYLPAVKALLESGADVNARTNYGGMPIMNSRTVEATELLIAYGADINSHQDDEDTALNFALSVNNAGLVEFLLEKGAKVNQRGFEGRAPLHLADNPAEAKVLLDHGARIDILDKWEMTPLDEAISDNNFDLASFLLERGAAVNSWADLIGSPFHIALRDNNLGMEKLLVRNGAEIFLDSQAGRGQSISFSLVKEGSELLPAGHDAYDVIAALINDHFKQSFGDGYSNFISPLVLVTPSPVKFSGDAEADRNRKVESLLKSLPGLEKETLDSAFEQGAKDAYWGPYFSKLKLAYQLVDEKELDSYMHGSGGWQAFRHDYHAGWGYYKFTRPLFNKKHTQALVSMSEHFECSGNSFTILLSKQEGEWRVDKYQTDGIWDNACAFGR